MQRPAFAAGLMQAVGISVSHDAGYSLFENGEGANDDWSRPREDLRGAA